MPIPVAFPSDRQDTFSIFKLQINQCDHFRSLTLQYNYLTEHGSSDVRPL